MAVEVLAGAVVADGGAWVGVAGGDLDVTEADAGVEHGGDEGVPQHVRVHPRHPDPGTGSQLLEAAGRGVPVQAPAKVFTPTDRLRPTPAQRQMCARLTMPSLLLGSR